MIFYNETINIWYIKRYILIKIFYKLCFFIFFLKNLNVKDYVMFICQLKKLNISIES